MKVCYLNSTLNPNTGAGRFYLSLTEALKKNSPNLEIIISTHDNGLPRNKFTALLSLPRLRRTFKHCDLVHALDGWPYGFLAALALLGLKKKMVITAVGSGAVKPLYSWWRRPLMKWVYKRADKIVAVSNNTKREILKIIPNLKIEVINHGVDFEKYQVSSIKYQAKNNLKPYILSVGYLKKRKGLDYSLRAFTEASKTLTSLNYVIVGDGPEKENLALLARELGVAERVKFLGHVGEEQKIALYKNAELFILLPQDSDKDIEGFGLVYLEAAACGLPVISAKSTSADDAVHDGKTGFLVSGNDIQVTASRIKEIIQSSALRAKLSVGAVELAKKMNWDSVARSYISIYRHEK